MKEFQRTFLYGIVVGFVIGMIATGFLIVSFDTQLVRSVASSGVLLSNLTAFAITPLAVFLKRKDMISDEWQDFIFGLTFGIVLADFLFIGPSVFSG